MEIQILEVARIELDGAVDFYNSESPGLGDEFLLEVLKTIDRIKLFTNAWHPFSANTRRCQVRRFPYGVIYQILNEAKLLIIAVSHLHMNPGYWKDRLMKGNGNV